MIVVDDDKFFIVWFLSFPTCFICKLQLSSLGFEKEVDDGEGISIDGEEGMVGWNEMIEWYCSSTLLSINYQRDIYMNRVQVVDKLKNQIFLAS